MNRLIEYARERLKIIEKGEGRFIDDEPLTIAGGNQTKPCNKIFPELTRYFSHTARPWPLIHKDGSISNEIVYCVRDSEHFANQTSSFKRGVLNTTVKGFLRSSAVRTEPGMYYDETTLHNVDWRSSYCVTVGNSSYIKVPMLIMGLTASYEYIGAEHIFNMAVACKDKTLAFVEGAGHNFHAQKEEYGDTVNSCFNYVAGWIYDLYAKI